MHYNMSQANLLYKKTLLHFTPIIFLTQMERKKPSILYFQDRTVSFGTRVFQMNLDNWHKVMMQVLLELTPFILFTNQRYQWEKQ